MESWNPAIFDAMWRGAVGVVPIALLVAVICRCLPHRPGTRHALWSVLLLALVALPLLPTVSDVLRIRGPKIDSQAGAKNENGNAPLYCAFNNGNEPSYSAARTPDPTGISDYADKSPVPVSSDGWAAVSPPEVDTRRVFAALLRATGLGDDSMESDLSAPNEFAEGAPPVTEGAGPAEAPPLPTTVVRIETERTETSRRGQTGAPGARSSGYLGVWRRWAVQIAGVRDAVGRVSPIPGSLWLTGAVMLGLLRAAGTLRLWRRVQGGQAAPADVERLVARTAEELRLRRAPRCVMTNARVSPMVWCGLCRVLVFPNELWSELDDAGRRAVVAHELAHLRRGDHWVRWFDLLVGCAYWWHPVVWWVSSQVQSEAESCCDAWVTWLMPRERRAYAGALLAARKFVSADPVSVPAVGMGADSRNRRSFARRLTMIMTRKDAPGLSLAGVAAAAALVLAGWMTTPACSQTAAAPPVAAGGAEAEGPYAVVASTGEVAAIAPDTGVGGAPAAQPPMTPSAAGSDVDLRLDRLEQQIERLMATVGASAAAGQPIQPPAPPAPLPPPLPSKDPVTSAVMKDGKISRAYHLPPEKLAALTKLMARSDVPVVVSPGADQIVVYATPAEQEVFHRFVGLIGEEERQSYTVAPGKLEALAELMLRDDVEVQVAREVGHIDVSGTPAVQQAFGDFVKLINGEPISWGHAHSGLFGPNGYVQPGMDAAGWADQVRSHVEAAVAARQYESYMARHADLFARRDALRQQTRNIKTHRAAIERQAERLRREAERVQREADRLREQAERMREQIGSKRQDDANAKDREGAETADDTGAMLELKFAELLAQVDARVAHVDDLLAQSDAFADEVSELDGVLAQMADELDEVNQQVDASEGREEPSDAPIAR